jgi:hypothetical protein
MVVVQKSHNVGVKIWLQSKEHKIPPNAKKILQLI